MSSAPSQQMQEQDSFMEILRQLELTADIIKNQLQIKSNLFAEKEKEKKTAGHKGR